MRKSIPVSEEIQQAAIAAYLAGASRRQVTQRFGITEGEFRRAMARHHVRFRSFRARQWERPPFVPFPDDIDREGFACWLSGFTDGEGHFGLNPRRTKGAPVAVFDIQLRADDRPVLELIRTFWGCGNIHLTPSSEKHHNPFCRYMVCDVTSLVETVVPHFEHFPLRAKKRRDFLIWREGVLFVFHRPRRGAYQWAEAEREEFNRLAALLKQQREYDPAWALPH